MQARRGSSLLDSSGSASAAVYPRETVTVAPDAPRPRSTAQQRQRVDATVDARDDLA